VARVASARRHAKAVFQIALETDTVELWRSDLKNIVTTLSDHELLAVLENPKIRRSEKMSLAHECLPGLSQTAMNFVYLLIARQRLGILSGIADEYGRMADAHEGLEHAKVTTAIALTPDDQRTVTERLAEITGKHLVLTADVDPAILGGFVAKIGDKLVDGSTRTKLESLRKALVKAV
jgi:F-type H+-transporting ATPase subunit delta